MQYELLVLLSTDTTSSRNVRNYTPTSCFHGKCCLYREHMVPESIMQPQHANYLCILLYNTQKIHFLSALKEWQVFLWKRILESLTTSYLVRVIDWWSALRMTNTTFFPTTSEHRNSGRRSVCDTIIRPWVNEGLVLRPQRAEPGSTEPGSAEPGPGELTYFFKTYQPNNNQYQMKTSKKFDRYLIHLICKLIQLFQERGIIFTFYCP